MIFFSENFCCKMKTQLILNPPSSLIRHKRESNIPYNANDMELYNIWLNSEERKLFPYLNPIEAGIKDKKSLLDFMSKLKDTQN